MKIFYGVDFSMNSPALTAISAGEIRSFFVPQKKVHEAVFSLGNYKIIPIGFTRKLNNSFDKYHENSEFIKKSIEWVRKEFSPKQELFAIEGYSYGSKGSSLFNIAENCGIMKYNLQRLHNIQFVEYSPSEIKKFATGKGTAKKDAMYKEFQQETGIKLDIMLNSKMDGNPVSDIVDSYFIAKLLQHKI